MPLGDYMMGCAAVLIGDREDGGGRGPIGTGFFVQVQGEEPSGRSYGYLITCHHVIEDQNQVKLKIPIPSDPSSDYYPLVDAPEFRQPAGWERLDLALAEFSVPKGYTVTALHAGFNLVERLEKRSLLAVPFHYVGWLAPLDLVMARTGTLGRVDEMLKDRGHAGRDYEYRTHIGDVRSYGGFSGSPCFVEYAVPSLTPMPPPMPTDTDEPVGRLRYLHLLCGMFTGHLDTRVPGRLVSRAGVGFILSSDEIWSVLMCDDLRRERRKKDKAAAPEDVRVRTGVDGGDEFQRFDELTRQLVNTPKPKISE